MLPETAIMVDEGGEYRFAREYRGPPIKGGIPRAIPIDVDSIPVAAVVSKGILTDTLAFPVVHPILTSDIVKKLPSDLSLGLESRVSPTSVIAFQRGCEGGEESVSKELGLGLDTTISPRSVKGYEEQGGSNGNSGLLSELSNSGGMECGNGDFESGEFSGVIDRYTEFGTFSTFRDGPEELIGRVESSGTVGFSGSFEKSRGLPASSRVSEVLSSGKESLSLDNSRYHDWESNESVLSMDYPSSRVSSLKMGDVIIESNSDVRRAPVDTFCDIESEDGDEYEDLNHDESEVVRPKREPLVKAKKGTCYRCLKGRRFTEKEACIVCDAKYCNNCVLRAMGSMPEGRKCVTCIGYPIDESKRCNLGKCSRMLKRLLNDLEVLQIMKAEKFCEVNQLPSEYIRVNERSLSHEELVVLQNCANPPKKLSPGNYWYDKVSGLWGKEGQKPSQIISPHLNVGAPIRTDASNGNTQVYINGREITKVELRMLQLAGVQCAGNPHFWVNDDGSYQEEGQKNTKGYIWGKARTKLVSAVLSLPVPSKPTNISGDQVSHVSSRTIPEYFEQKPLQKILLIGYNGSGTSTIFKQAKILYNDVPFSEDERGHIKLLIQSNVYGYLGILLEGRERFEEERMIVPQGNQSCDELSSPGCTNEVGGKTMYSLCPKLKTFSDWLLKIMVSGSLEAIFPAATREYAPLVEELWKDEAIKATYKRRGELEMLPSIASYFLEKVVDILKPDYEPSDLDILYAEGVTSTNGLASVEFSFPESEHEDHFDSGDVHDAAQKFQLIRVQARGFGENCKWFERFEDVRVVILCVSLSDYDLFVDDGNGELVNKMLLSKRFFESIISHPTFDQVDVLLLLNKYDAFEEKLERVPLSHCEWFQDFRPLPSRHRSSGGNSSINHNPSLGQLAFHYLAVKFKRLYSELTGKKLYVSLAKDLEPKSVDGALKYSREIIRWNDQQNNFSLQDDYSDYSETSSLSSSPSH